MLELFIDEIIVKSTEVPVFTESELDSIFIVSETGGGTAVKSDSVFVHEFNKNKIERKPENNTVFFINIFSFKDAQYFKSLQNNFVRI